MAPGYGIIAAVLAHAFGARYNLPVPLVLFVLGGAAVVLVSFLLVAARPVTGEAASAAPATDGRAAPRSGAGRWPAWIAGLGLGLLMVAGWAGSQVPSENLLPTAFWLLIWVAVPISCAAIGDWTVRVNPMAALARAADREGLRRRLLGGTTLPWPRRLGWWPAAVLFVMVAAGELIFNDTATLPAVTAWGLLLYGVTSAMAGLVVGAEAWCARGELFAVLFATWGRLGWFRFGAPGRRGLGGGLGPPLEAGASRITFVLLLLVSVSYDGLLTTDAWKQLRLHLPFGIEPNTGAYRALTTAGLVGLLGLSWVLFGLFAAAVRRAGGLRGSPLEILAGLLPSLLPIAAGYLIAHNLEYLAINGQLLLPLAGDPAGRGWHLLPAPFNDTYVVNRDLLPSGAVWYGQVLLIIGVHIAAVVQAHRYLGRAARTVRLARRSEWPWIAAMVGYTMTSLWLLSQPLVEEHAPTARVPAPQCVCAPT